MCDSSLFDDVSDLPHQTTQTHGIQRRNIITA
jgi:hypothetical protein